MHPLSNYTLHLEKCCQTGASCSSNADVAASKLKNPWRITHTFHLYTVGLLLRRSTAWQLLHKVLKMYTLQHGWKRKPETIPWPVAQLLSFLHWVHMWDVFNSWCVCKKKKLTIWCMRWCDACAEPFHPLLCVWITQTLLDTSLHRI